jgi:hypothetical protein
MRPRRSPCCRWASSEPSPRWPSRSSPSPKGKPRLAAASAILLVAVGVLTVSVGAWLQATELRHLEWALPNASPVDREAIRLAGARRARTSLIIGLFVALLPLASACVCLGHALIGRASRLAVGGGLVLALAVVGGVGSVAQGQYRLGKAEVAQSVRLQGGAWGSASSSAEGSSISRAAWLVIPLAVVGARGREGMLPDSETHFTLSDWTSPVYGRSDIGP